MDNYNKALLNKFGEGWYNFLKEELNQPYFIKLLKIVAKEREQRIIYPEKDKVFEAFRLCPLEKTKVIIIGLDPYHDGSALGLAFGSTNNNPSLQKIMNQLMFYEEFGEIDVCIGREPTLQYLAVQGVLLLNTILTVRRGKSKSHAGIGWEVFTTRLLAKLSREKKELVYLLWGRDAQEASREMDYMNNLVIITEHPAAAAYANRAWKDDLCFTKANEYLISINKKIINW